MVGDSSGSAGQGENAFGVGAQVRKAFRARERDRRAAKTVELALLKAPAGTWQG